MKYYISDVLVKKMIDTYTEEKEFLADLVGEIKGKNVYFYDIYYVIRAADKNSASRIWITGGFNAERNVIGTFHTHPGIAFPSEQDKVTFSKYGGFHFILGKPPKLQNLKLFDKYGNPLSYKTMTHNEIMTRVGKKDEKELKPLKALSVSAIYIAAIVFTILLIIFLITRF